MGAFIGGSLDTHKSGGNGEISDIITKTEALSIVIGGICGSYIGYRLAKRQVEMKTKALKKDNPEEKEFNFRPYKN